MAIEQYSKDGRLVMEYQSACEASRITGISLNRIICCISGRNFKEAGGYIWKRKV